MRQDINSEASSCDLEENDGSRCKDTEWKNSLLNSIMRNSGNQYRRPRRGACLGSWNSSIRSDIVRSDYEQEQIIAELTAKETMEKRITQGGSKLPRQQCALEKETYCSFVDLQENRRVDDPVQYEEEKALINSWTDVEKTLVR